MERNTDLNNPILCPSVQPKMEGSVVFGVITGTIEEPRFSHLVEPQPVTDELLALSKLGKPTEVFRFAAPCASKQCQRFDGFNCRLATKIVQLLPEVATQLPPCRLRPNCR